MLYYFQSEIILLLSESSSTSFRKYLYFRSKIPLLFTENTSTFAEKYLYFSEEVEVYPRGSTITS